MVKVPDIQKQPAGIVLVSNLVDETAFRIPPRRVLGSTGISVAVHGVIFMILSLVLLSGKEPNESLHTVARFEEPGNAEDSNWVEIDALELPPVQEAAASMRELASLTTGSALLPSANIDLSRFGNQLSEAGAADGLPSEVAAIAGAVQGRVSKAGGRTGEVQFSPDGRWLATTGYEQGIDLWDWPARRLVYRVEEGSGWIYFRGYAFSPDSRLLAWATRAGPAAR